MTHSSGDLGPHPGGGAGAPRPVRPCRHEGGTPELLTERKETFNKVSFLSSVDSGVPPSCLLEFDGTTWEAESVLDSDNLDRIRPALHPEVESEVIPILRYCPNNPKGKKNKQTTYKR